MKTLGIDLASAPKKTGYAVVRWTEGAARVEALGVGADDDALIASSEGAAAIGIDAPFGWPRSFVELVSGGAPPSRWNGESRDALRFRASDRAVRDRFGRWPLSVSSDLIAIPAFRAQGLLRRLGVEDRSGDGRVFETYPALALHVWGLGSRGYKTKAKRAPREVIWNALRARTPWLEMDASHDSLAVDSDDALDALVAALVARAAVLGRVEPIPEQDRDAARDEGWIATPHADALEHLHRG